MHKRTLSFLRGLHLPPPIQMGLSIIQKTFQRWASHHPDFLAAGIAFFALFSAVPLMLLVSQLCRQLLGFAYQQEDFIASLERWMGPRALEGFAKWLTLGSSENSGAGTLLGTVGLFFAASYVFIQLESALHSLWDIAEPKGQSVRLFLHSRLKSVVFTWALCTMMLLSLLGEAGLSIVTHIDPSTPPTMFMRATQFFVSLFLFSLFFTLLLRFAPRQKLDWKCLAWGGFATSVLFLAGKLFLGYYVTWSRLVSAQGVAGTILVFLLWVYYSVLIFLWGASLAKVLSNARTSSLKA